MDEQSAALAAALRADAELRERLAAASDAAEFERLAAEAGFAVRAADFLHPASDDLSDAELEGVSGGTYPHTDEDCKRFPQTDWIYCENPWTNAYCTLKC